MRPRQGRALSLTVRTSSDQNEPFVAFEPTNNRSAIDGRFAQLPDQLTFPLKRTIGEQDASDTADIRRHVGSLIIGCHQQRS